MERERLRRNLQHQRRWGVRYRLASDRGADTPVGPGQAEVPAARVESEHDESGGAENHVGPEPAVRADVRAPQDALAALREEVVGCSRCEALVANRTQTVFADGAPTSPLMFVGEAPGADEDRDGVPFVGRAGMLLTDIIQKGMGIPRRAVYIANILKCRPPGNRDPLPDETHNCTGYLIRQIEAVRPRVLVALGRPSAQFLFDSGAPLGRLRGRLTDATLGDVDLKLMATYHPAYVLRTYTIENRRAVFDDVQKVVAYLKELGEWPWWE